MCSLWTYMLLLRWSKSVPRKASSLAGSVGKLASLNIESQAESVVPVMFQRPADIKLPTVHFSVVALRPLPLRFINGGSERLNIHKECCKILKNYVRANPVVGFGPHLGCRGKSSAHNFVSPAEMKRGHSTFR